jgi:paraquat-inducible protein B
MSEGDSTRSEEELPEAVVETRGGRRWISSVWLIPLVAAIVGGGLAYRTLSERGPLITITFQTAAGLEAGKTTIRYKNFEIGTVEGVEFADDMSHAIVAARLGGEVKSHLVEGARFWVVRPRIGFGGVSGLDTLISGTYIAIEPGPPGNPKARHFVGLEAPPPYVGEVKGLELELRANRLGGLGSGSPIYHRDVPVGQITSYAFAKDGDDIVLHAIIEERFADLVRENTHFWNRSGIEVSASLTGGFDLDVESLRSILSGGVDFETPGAPGKLAAKGARFRLHDHRERAKAGLVRKAGTRFVVEAAQLGSLKAGDPVLYREERIGTILSHELHPDARSVGILIQVDDPYARLVRTNSVFWDASGISADLGLKGLHIHTESLQALLAGGIGLATPDEPGPRAQAGSVFKLHDEAREKWHKWSPRIWIGPEQDPTAPAAATPDEPEPELVHHKSEATDDPESHHWFHRLFHFGKD